MDLLTNKMDNIEYINERLEHTNFSLNENILILSIPFKQKYKDYRHNFGLKQLITRVKNLLGNCISTYYKDMIVFLVSNECEQVIDDRIKEDFLEFLKLNNLKCGISIIFKELYNIQDFFINLYTL